MGIFNWYHQLAPESEKKTKAHGTPQQASERRFSTGGLPDEAVRRMNEQAAKQGTPEHLWSSNLSVNELLLTRECGFAPLGQVMGTSVYQVGWQWRNPVWLNSSMQNGGGGYEFDIQTKGFLNTRNLALSRLKKEAELLGATGVIGVQIKTQNTDWENGLLEFSVIGTAIRETHLPLAGSTPGRYSPLFLSELSGQEYWQLRQAGFRPVGIAIGYCVFCQVSNIQTRTLMAGGLFNGSNWRNAELSDFTQGLYSARSLAMERMEHDALSVNAEGIVSVDVKTEVEIAEAETKGQNSPYHLQYMIVRFSAIGTAIESFPMRAAWSTSELTVSLASEKNPK